MLVKLTSNKSSRAIHHEASDSNRGLTQAKFDLGLLNDEVVFVNLKNALVHGVRQSRGCSNSQSRVTVLAMVEHQL